MTGRNAPRFCRACGDRPARGPHKLYCFECMVVAERAERRKSRERKRRQRQDPRVAEKRREASREYRRASRERRATDEPPPLPGFLPSAPLLAALEVAITRDAQVEPVLAVAARNHRGGAEPSREAAMYGRDEVVCQRAGISSKTLREWRRGKRPRVQFGTADLMLQNLGLLWQDVWDPAEFPELAEVMG